MRIALLYDYLKVRGGAEKLSMVFARKAGDVDLVVAFANEKLFSSDELSSVTTLSSEPWFDNVYAKAIRTLFSFIVKTRYVRQYDVVVYSGIYALAAVIWRRYGNIYYCHTPPRIFHDQRERYESKVPMALRGIFHFILAGYEKVFGCFLSQMNTVIANSDNVRKRLWTQYGVNSIVINPPVDVDKFRWVRYGDYYVSTARHEENKRVDTIIRAFLKLAGKKLVVLSGGSQTEQLKMLAAGAKNITFIGWCDDQVVQEVIGSCKATIYIPEDEDFGMSPIESMAAGKPVIGVNEGGLKETIVHEETGFLLNPNPTVGDLERLISKVDKMDLSLKRCACEQKAQQYSTKKFIKKLKNEVHKVILDG